MCTVTYVEQTKRIYIFFSILFFSHSVFERVLFFFCFDAKFFQSEFVLLVHFNVLNGWESLSLEKLNGIRIFIETLSHFIDIDGIIVGVGVIIIIVGGITISLFSNGKVYALF